MNAYEYTYLTNALTAYAAYIDVEIPTPDDINHGPVTDKHVILVMSPDAQSAHESVRMHYEETGAVYTITKVIPLLRKGTPVLWDMPLAIKVEPNPFMSEANQTEYNRQVDAALTDILAQREVRS